MARRGTTVRCSAQVETALRQRQTLLAMPASDSTQAALGEEKPRSFATATDFANGDCCNPFSPVEQYWPFGTLRLVPMCRPRKICILGSGNWGSAIAKIIGTNAALLDTFETEVRTRACRAVKNQVLYSLSDCLR